jgi:4-carboxymuconolactone decarboxylase
MQMALYAGFPAALNALFAARDIFERHDGESERAQPQRRDQKAQAAPAV